MVVPEAKRSMNSEIKIIKRAARGLFQAESVETPVAPDHHEPNEPSSLQITRTIKDWVKANNKRNSEKLLVAQSLRRCPKLAKLRVDIVG